MALGRFLKRLRHRRPKSPSSAKDHSAGTRSAPKELESNASSVATLERGPHSPSRASKHPTKPILAKKASSDSGEKKSDSGNRKRKFKVVVPGESWLNSDSSRSASAKPEPPSAQPSVHLAKVRTHPMTQQPISSYMDSDHGSKPRRQSVPSETYDADTEGLLVDALATKKMLALSPQLDELSSILEPILEELHNQLQALRDLYPFAKENEQFDRRISRAKDAMEELTRIHVQLGKVKDRVGHSVDRFHSELGKAKKAAEALTRTTSRGEGSEVRRRDSDEGAVTAGSD